MEVKRYYDSNVIVHTPIAEQKEIESVKIGGPEEPGDEFTVFRTIVENGEFRRSYIGVEEIATQRTAKNALGTLANGDVIVVEVEKNEESQGVTMKQLANIMVELGSIEADFVNARLTFGDPPNEDITDEDRPSEEEVSKKPTRKRK